MFKAETLLQSYESVKASEEGVVQALCCGLQTSQMSQKSCCDAQSDERRLMYIDELSVGVFPT